MQISTRTYIKITALLALSNISPQTFCETPSNQNAKFPRCEIPNTVGSHPLEACSLMEKLKKDREAMKDDKYILSRRKCDDYDNIIILEGENGTGKKFLLRHILFAAHCYQNTIHEADLLEHPRAANEIIDRAIKFGQDNHSPAVILISNIDAYSSDKNSPRYAAYMSLWRCIETHKNNAGVYFVFTTTGNHNAMPPHLQSKLYAHTIQVNNPDEQSRKELLNHFSKRYTQKEINTYCPDECLQTIVRATKDFNIRNLADLCKNAEKSASLKNEQIAQPHLMEQIEKIKKFNATH